MTLPDGSVKEFQGPVTGLEIAESIGSQLAKDAVTIAVDGQWRDLSSPINESATVAIITKKQDEALEVLRHDAAHVMAEAVKELYPETQVTIGPAIENGFYYDFHRETSFTPEDLEKIEKRMKEIVDRNEEIIREEWDRDDAITFFKDQGEAFKAEIIAEIPAGETISLYRQGNFIDLCRGPHLPSTGRLGKAFKLTKLAGAYWRGDSKNPMLQRIYGTAWATEKQLKAYLLQVEEAEKRDHRKLGRALNLFHIQEEAQGSIFWHPKGWALYRLLQEFVRRRISKQGYQEVNTPQLLDKSFWEASGHWEKFRDDMFAVEDGDKTLALKPMNCPCHIQIFKQGMKSYRDLPLRMAEFGSCIRNEASGALHGLMRVRSMVQDDAHIFCTEDQITEETIAFCELLTSIYKDLGFEEISVKFADRPEKRAGSDAVWDKAEKALLGATKKAGLPYTLNPGEGAFYGPKLEFYLRDAIGRSWQCGTLQADFVLAERLDASYIGEDGQKHRPVLLHRAVLGSLERFIGILIENYNGKFPLWLSPTQVAVASISQEVNGYAEEVVARLKDAGFRVEQDLRAEKINYKIRELSHKKIPVIFVVGHKEADEKTVAVRRLGGKNQEVLALQEALDRLGAESRMP